MLITGDVRWNETADIVVIGLGSAGAVSAIAAHDLGVRVIILEKQPAQSHVSTSHMSGGLFICPRDISEGIAYMEHLAQAGAEGRYWTDRDTIKVFAEYLYQNIEWMEKLGGEITAHEVGAEKGEWREKGEYDAPGRQTWVHCSLPGSGPGLMRFLKGQAESRGIPVLYNTAADRLLTDVRGEVVGVRAKAGGKETNIKAARAVIMTPGGFEFDEEMKLNYLRVYPTYFAGSPANTGDGIRMAQDVGASLWHMNCCSASWVLKFDNCEVGLGPNFRGTQGGRIHWVRAATEGNPCGYVIVDKRGRRFTNEEMNRHAVYYELTPYDSHTLEYPRVPSYWVFDRKRIEASPLPMMWYGPMLYREEFSCSWSKDNKPEIDKGWIVQGSNIEELANKLKMAPSVLAKTVRDYNTYCENKEDPEFHRPAKHLVPLVEPPFFAVAIWPGSANTLGGPRRNQKGQVLDIESQPIPRLYAAGEMGSLWGMIYQGGGDIAECIATGRIAAENAVKEARLA